MTAKSPAPLLGIVLCGGKSSRMGRDKSLIQDKDGYSYLDIAVERLATTLDQVVLSGRPQTETELTVIPDGVADKGPVMGIVSALKFASQNGFAGGLVTPVDTPFLKADHLQLLIDRWRLSQGLTVASSDCLQPLIAIYPTEVLPALQRLSESEDRSLFRWLGSQSPDLVELPEAVCRNINTPDDLN